MSDSLKSLMPINGPETIKLGQETDAPPVVESPSSVTTVSSMPAKTTEIVKPQGADVYAMPKEFQRHNKVAGGNSGFWGVVVILASFVFLVVVGGGFYLYIFNPALLSSWTDKIFGVQNTPTLPAIVKNEPTQMPTDPVIEPTAPNVPVMPQQTPQQVYRNYVNELLGARIFGDYYAVVSRYGDRRRLASLEAERLVAETSPADSSASMELIKERIVLAQSANIIEEISGQQAVVRITTLDNQNLGTITLVVEEAAWKISQEDWLPIAKKTEAITYVLGADRDNDGLTDAEEDLLGSNKDSADSDNDGFGDLREVLNLYNPVGKDKLIDNPRIKSYLADDQSFYFLYPSTWTRVSDKGSPVFTSPDGHFIQLIVSDNERRETLDDYARNTLGLMNIEAQQRQTEETWRGIITADGLTMHIMGNKQDKIYTWHYSPANSAVLEYPNIFKVFIKSFVIKK